MSEILSEKRADKAKLKDMVLKMLEAILDSFDDESAFSGVDPLALRERINALDFLPEEGKGFDSTLEMVKREVFPHMLRTWSPSYMPHLHSPALTESIATELAISIFNNSMDSWDQAPAATEIEVMVINRLNSLFTYDENAGGVFTSGGSQSNLFAILAARDRYCEKYLGSDVKKNGNPDCYKKLRLYTSELSHFSMEKSAHTLGLGYQSVVKLPTDERCKIDLKKTEEIIESDVKAGLIPFLLVATAGTTDFGSIDDVKALREITDKYHMFLHTDAAYGSGLIMSDKYGSRIEGINLSDSITVDFHKMFLLPISCSALLVKDASLLDCFELHADYLNREEDEEDGYINLVGRTMQTTRRSDALKVLIAFNTQGKNGYGAIIDKDVENASYVYKKLSEDPAFITGPRPELSSVVFALKAGDEANKKARRSLMNEGIVIGQTVYNARIMLKLTLLNPNITFESLDNLLEKIKKTLSS